MLDGEEREEKEKVSIKVYLPLLVVVPRSSFDSFRFSSCRNCLKNSNERDHVTLIILLRELPPHSLKWILAS